MTEENKKKQGNPNLGYFLIVLGIIGLSTRFIGNSGWTTVAMVKMGVSIAAIAVGGWILSTKKKEK